VDITVDEINGLIERPSEGLNVEIKGWVDPSSREGTNKIIKATLALRNRNGGFLLFGFDNGSLLPDAINPAPIDVRQAFHVDVIQGIVSRAASEAFEIRVGFGMRDAKEFPVIKVQEGVRSPVAVCRDYSNGSGGYSMRVGDVFFRTFNSNGIVSSARARPEDWPEIVQICFENREADIGRFLRRHLSSKDVASMLEALNGMRAPFTPALPALRDRAHAALADGELRFQAAIKERSLSEQSKSELDRGMWQVSLAVDPIKTDVLSDDTFLNLALNSNPNFTGWPVWIDSRGFNDRDHAPYVLEKAWQALIVSLGQGWSRHLDFVRLNPIGEFYLQRISQDDLTDKVAPTTSLDAVLAIIRTAEAIAVGISMVKALGWDDEAQLGFAFRWTKLRGRELCCWVNPLVHISAGRRSHEDSVETFIEVRAGTPLSAIAPYVENAMRDLFVAFNGMKLSSSVYEEWTQKLLERRL
jgi:hypothetical protein